MFTIVAWRDRGRGSGRRKEADVKAARRAVAKGWRGVEVGMGVGVAWRVEVWEGERRVERPVREIVRGCGGGASVGVGSEIAGGGGSGGFAESGLIDSFTSVEVEEA